MTISEIIGMITSVFAILFGASRYHLAEATSRHKIIAFLQQENFWQRYQNAVRIYLLKPTENWFGKKYFSWQAYDRCLTIAFIYPIWLLIIAWMFGGTGELGSLKLLDNQITIGQKVFEVSLLVISTLYFFYWLVKKNGGIWIANKLLTSLKKPNILLKINHTLPNNPPKISMLALIGALVGALVGAVIGVVALVDSGALAGALAAAGLLALTAALAVAGTKAKTLAGTVAGALILALVLTLFGALAIAGAIMGTINGTITLIEFLTGAGVGAGTLTEPVSEFLTIAVTGTEIGLSLAIFLALLPILNALLDWLSLATSRYLISHVLNQRNKNWLMLLKHIILDIALAVIFMLSIATLIPISLQATNLILAFFEFELILSWKLLLDQTRQEPFTQGLLVTGMLFTTLIPTFLHLILCVLALLCPVIPYWLKARLFNWLGYNQTQQPIQSIYDLPVDHDSISRVNLSAASMLVTLFIMLSLTPIIGLVFLVYQVPSHEGAFSAVGQFLYEWALMIGRWIGSPGFN